METSPSASPLSLGSGGAPTAAPGIQRLERMADLVASVGLKKSQMFALIRSRQFPQPIKCGRSSLFVSAEIDTWISERIRAHRGTDRT